MKDKGAVVYYRISPKRKEYIGECFFKFDYNSECVVQIRFKASDERGRGKSNNIGIYMIARITFLSNYFAPGYIEPSNKKEFDKKFTTILNLLHTLLINKNNSLKQLKLWLKKTRWNTT